MKDKLETQEETIKVLVSEKNYLKKAYDTQIKKLKDIQEKNYLVSKDDIPHEDPLVYQLQKEIRQLH